MKFTWDDVRNEFPVCREYVYLNPAGGSPLSASAADHAKAYYDEMLTYGDTMYGRWMERSEQTRNLVASFLGADSSEIAFTTNTSHGMNLVALMNKGKGNVLTMHDEFPSTTFPWINQAAELKMVMPDIDNCYPVEKIEAAITPDIKILMTSYIQYRTGFRQNLNVLGNLCRRKNLVFIVNATQAFPVFPIDVKNSGIDFLVFSGLKWSTAGYGTGGLFISSKWLEQGNLPFAGWLGTNNPGAMDNMAFEPPKRASVVEGGCPHFAPIFALKGALTLFAGIGRDRVMERILNLNMYLHKRLGEIGINPAGPLEKEYMSGITIIKTEKADEIADRLKEEKIIVSARGQGIRVSVSIFNNERDIDRLAEALKKFKDSIIENIQV